MELVRKIGAEILTDPIGGSCLMAGTYSAYKDISPYVFAPLLALGLYHTIEMRIQRRKVLKEVKESGLIPKLCEKWNKRGLCSRYMVLGVAFRNRKYNEIKESLQNYPLTHYTKQFFRTWKTRGKMILKGKNPIKVLFD